MKSSYGNLAWMALSLLLIGWQCQSQVNVHIEGNPSRPTFVFGDPVILGSCTLHVYDDKRWTGLWGIERTVSKEYVRLRQVEYGVVPNGYSEYLLLKHTELKVNKLYMFRFDGGANRRGSDIFAIVSKEGRPTIVQFDEFKSLEDIVAEFERMVRPG